MWDPDDDWVLRAMGHFLKWAAVLGMVWGVTMALVGIYALLWWVFS